MAYLGIDLGTSGLRALLVDDTGAPIGVAEEDYPVSRPHPGWSEQDPADWIRALDAAIGTLRAKHREFTSVRGIAVAGHMHGATLLDAQDQVIRPCILWNDTRSHAEAARLDANPGVRAASGNIVFPGFTAPKLAWVAANEPDVSARVAKVLLPAAFLNFYLTGEHVADLSDSAGTAWLNVAERDWSELLLTAGGMRRDQMPGLAEGCEAAGQLRRQLAHRWGLNPSVVVAAGAGDNAAAACGCGAVRDGEGFVSLGTSGVLLVAREACSPAPDTAVHTFCHAVPGRWIQMGVMLAATDNLNWLSGVTGQNAASMTDALGDDLQAPGRVQFLPYLSGERTPHNDPNVRAGVLGIGAGTTREDLTRAVLEGVAFGLRDSAEAIRASGAEVGSLYAVGGGAASRYWLRLIATVLNVPLKKASDGEFGAALGACRLAMAAATDADPLQIMTSPPIDQVVDPEPKLASAFEEAYRRFCSAYPAIRQIL